MSENAAAQEETTARAGHRRLLFAGAGLGAAALLGGVWAARLPLGEFALRQALSAPGEPTALKLRKLDFAGLELADVRAGPPAAPDLTARRITVSWRGAFTITGVRLEGAVLRARVSGKGLSLGAFDKFRTTGPARQARVPDWTINARDLRLIVESPLGVSILEGEAQGALRRDFTALLRVRPGDMQGEGGGMKSLAGEISAQSRAGRVALRAALSAASLEWRGAATLDAPSLRAQADAPIDLASAQAAFSANAGGADAYGVHFAAPQAHARIAISRFGPGFSPEAWRAAVSAALPAAQGARTRAAGANLQFTAQGGAADAQGRYILTADRFTQDGYALRAARLEGPASARYDGALNIAAQGQLAARASAEPAARRALLTRLPALGGTPLAPLTAQAKAAFDRALMDFTVAAPLDFAWAKGQGRLAAHGGDLRAASGVALTVSPIAGPPLGIVLPRGEVSGAARLTLAGPGAPTLRADIARFATAPLTVIGQAAIADWRAPGAALRAEAIAFDLQSGVLKLDGATTVTGPLAGMQLTEAVIPVQLAARFSDGFRVEPSGGACPHIAAKRIDAFGLTFDNAQLAPCPAEGGAFAAADAQGHLSGGFTFDRLALAGRMGAKPARFTAGRIAALLSGQTDAPQARAEAEDLTLAIAFDPARTVTVRGARIDALYRGGETWRADGALADVWVVDSSVGPRLEALNARWSAEPARGGVRLALRNGAARVLDPSARPVIHPLRLREIAGGLDGGEAFAKGVIRLENGEARLGAFTVRHVLKTGAGEARAQARDLQFSSALQPYQISELTRGVMDIVRGPLDADITARWTQDAFATGAVVTPKNISLATIALGPIEGIQGAVTFDDFLALTTPPGQIVRTALINPGVPVRDGVIQFQLLRDQQARLEDARWPFLGGVLAIEPTTIAFAGEENRMTLRLADVDVAELTRQLNVKGLTATGVVSGRMPLMFTKKGGRIEHGELTAGPAGGVIQYASDLQQTGAAQMAFDALRSFRYDALTLDIDGALDDELVTQIAFSGRNREPVAQGGGTGGVVRLVGVPFKFNVSVRAPFFALARSAAGFSDARKLLEEAAPEISAEVAGAPVPAETPRN